MVHKLIEWSVHNPLLIILLTVGLLAIGLHAFLEVNVEAYPDPAPAIIEVIAQYPGASAEEMERQVTNPLEVTLAGIPGLKYTRSKSLFGLSHLRNQFDYGIDFYKARQEVINRLQFVQNMPSTVTPIISPATPIGEIYRYTLRSPKDGDVNIYTLNDLKALQDWVLEREFRRIPRIAGVTSTGASTKRYEIQPDPDLLKRYGVTLQQLADAVSKSNANMGGNYLNQGQQAHNVRGIGLIGAGRDPVQDILGIQDPSDIRAAARAAAHLRQEERQRILDIRKIVIESNNGVPVHVENLVEEGPLASEHLTSSGVMVGNQTRLGRICSTRPKKDEYGHVLRDSQGHVIWDTDYDTVQGIVLLRKNEESLPALESVETRVNQLNTQPGRMLPGVKIEPYYDRKELIHITTETVQENLLLGMGLVTVILLMFLSNVRSALIVAINIPLALLFAFTMLFLRGKSANLLSIGAVDFGIIVDSSVIMVENIYRHIASNESSELPFRDRILQATREVERSLFFSTAIMVCAFLPLFTMQGPEGQIFGPMADTYAFALGGALLLALMMAPVLCLLFFKNLQPAQDNFFVSWLKSRYLRQLGLCLKYRWITLAVMVGLVVFTIALLPHLGREFMPPLEEGNLYIRGTFPLNMSLDAVTNAIANPPSPGQSQPQNPKIEPVLEIIRRYPEVESVVAQIGRPDDGTDPTGFYNVEIFVPLKRHNDWPAVKKEAGLWSRLRSTRPRTKLELIQEMHADLTRIWIGVDWNFSQNIRDNVMESLSGVKGDNSVKIFGPDLYKLEELASRVKAALETVNGIREVGIFHIQGQSNLELRIDPQKCERLGVSVADVNSVIEAVRGKAVTQMIEGEKIFDITVRWPQRMLASEDALLQIPVDITTNSLSNSALAGTSGSPTTGSSVGMTATGTSRQGPTPFGSQVGASTNPNITDAPRRPLHQLVSPIGKDGRPNPSASSFVRTGASTIYREQGQRLIAVKFSVRGRDLASAVAEAKNATSGLLQAPYRAEWSGEFQEMEEAEGRLFVIIPISLVLIFILLYLAFHSLLDTLAVLSNVAALSMGGVWALYVTGTNFSISAAVGFISIFGVAIMDGLLLISYFNHLRAEGMPLDQAIMEGSSKRVRPVMMTALTAVFGLLPAAVSTRIGAQTQQPLAIVVVGGMITILLLTRYLMPVLYSFYGHREPPASTRGLAH